MCTSNTVAFTGWYQTGEFPRLSKGGTLTKSKAVCLFPQLEEFHFLANGLFFTQ